MANIQEKARFLIECLPYIQKFFGRVIVIKYGGHAMTDDTLKLSFAQNIALMQIAGIKPVIVHGGGPQIARLLEKLAIPTSFCEGLRVTDDATMEVVEMVLSAQTNKSVVNMLNRTGVKAVGISGKDANLITVRKTEMMTKDANGNPIPADLGWVGDVSHVDTKLLESLLANNFIPVVSPVAVDEHGNTYNVNADSAAGAVAAAMGAERFLNLTDVAGVLDKEKNLLKSLSVKEVEALFADGTIAGGMIPKIKCCLDAVRGGARKSMIIDGRVENCILLELFTDQGIGTEITA